MARRTKSPPRSCATVTRYAPQKGTPDDPGQLRSCPKVAEQVSGNCSKDAPRAQIRPQTWPSLADWTVFGPISGQSGPSWSKSDQVWPNSLDLGPNLANFETRAQIDQSWSILAKRSPFGQNWLSLGDTSTKVGQLRAGSPNCPESAEIAPNPGSTVEELSDDCLTGQHGRWPETSAVTFPSVWRATSSETSRPHTLTTPDRPPLRRPTELTSTSFPKRSSPARAESAPTTWSCKAARCSITTATASSTSGTSGVGPAQLPPPWVGTLAPKTGELRGLLVICLLRGLPGD